MFQQQLVTGGLLLPIRPLNTECFVCTDQGIDYATLHWLLLGSIRHIPWISFKLYFGTYFGLPQDYVPLEKFVSDTALPGLINSILSLFLYMYQPSSPCPDISDMGR